MRYYVYKDGKITGPFEKEQILGNPNFDEDDLVRAEDYEN